MVNVHVAHDCVVGDKIVITNNTILGGHTHVESIVINLGRRRHSSVRDDRIATATSGPVAYLP